MTPFLLPTTGPKPCLGETDLQDVAAWLRLANASGLPPIALRALLAEFGGPQAVLNQPFGALAATAGEKAAHAVLGAPPRSELGSFDECLARTLEWASVPGNTIVTLADCAYPPALLTMPDPPPLLYVKGRLDLLHARAVAIVGSRSATPQGIDDARRFAQALSDAGLAIVSGLALGIDGAAHRGGLSGPGGTIAVIGTGADLVYPPLHHALAHEIATNGTIVSEWPLGTPARPANFPQRNRLIAGLASGVLIVEAAMRSGSLITARFANEMGRDVFAIPGSIHAPLSRGCHRMIKQGAKLVETPEDILEEFGFTVQSEAAAAPVSKPRKRGKTRPSEDAGTGPATSEFALQLQDASGSGCAARGKPASASWASASLKPADPEAERLLDALGHSPATLEILAERTDMDGATLQSLLLQLELSGRIGTLPGGRFARLER
ncbi:DNA-processing protein DprA [Caballeronia sordidicola]|jgi:DNA processing protein|uniref:Rossmann fold nucleotide-binding protein n=1 Tax=Caballeronia sordidicola TaxID=196367 RepID=A0A226WJP8_CABSO|nr:DNA-processing protein DprA [Caballeronia sordidicola]OXC71424.1 Rossmann fold nucleotide-binding protein [Caballeronia sordidicola]